VKVTLAIYLRNFVRKIVSSDLTELNAAYHQKLMALLYQTLVSAHVEFTVKRHLYLIFESLLQIYQSSEPHSAKIQEFYNNLFTSIEGLLGQYDIEVTKGVLLVCQAALSNIRPIATLAKLFSGIATLMCKLADHYVSKLGSDLMVVGSLPAGGLTVDNPQIQSILAALDLLQQWTSVHQSVLEKFQSKKYYAYQLFATSEAYAFTFISIIGILVQSPSQDMKCFISLTGIEKLDQLLNSVKVKTLECLNSIFTYIFEEVPNNTKKESVFLIKAGQLCPFIV
jgi:hypothetical protein